LKEVQSQCDRNECDIQNYACRYDIKDETFKIFIVNEAKKTVTPEKFLKEQLGWAQKR